uniref:Uncharacterized protein n=1 Tax=Panagrolaimus davidi TaxID=227884 RepID=A0A914PZU9_9BILA
MIYEFSRNGVTKKLNEKSATPANLSKHFKVTLDSLTLTNDGGDFINVKGTEFDQPLKDGAVYQVEGDEISLSVTTAGAANANVRQLVVRQNMHLISTQDQLQEVFDSISSSTEPIDDNICLLYDGPNAVSVVNFLAILAAATDDPSLISEIMPRDQFKYIKNPGSFRASLYQGSTSMCCAFQKAYNSMGIIYAYLEALPKDIQNALIEMVRGNSPNELNRLIRSIGKSLEGCMNSAKEAKDTFNSVLEVLQEIILGAISAQSASEKNRKDALKQLEEFKIKQKQQNEEIANRETQYQENAKLVQEALENYKEASVPVDVVDLIGLTVVDVVKDSVSEIIGAPRAAASFVAQQVGIISCDPERKSNKNELDAVYVEEINEVIFEIQSADELTVEAINEWIDRLEIITGSSRIADVMSKVKDLRIHLQRLKKNPELLKTDKKVALMSKEILKLLSAFHRHIELKNQQSAEREKARLSLAETRVKEHTKVLDNARDRLDKEEERKDKNLEAMRQSKRELADLMAKMKNLDLTKVEMNGDGDVVETLVKPALVASGMCVQICNCASIYRAISEEFVMPEITKVARNVSLSKEDAKKKKNDIEMVNENINESVRQFVDTKKKAFEDKFKDNLEIQQTKLLQAITQ